MLVRDIDMGLDMRMILKLRQNTELFNALSELKTKLPVYIYGKGPEAWMTTYFSKNMKIQKIDVLLRRFNAIELEDSYAIDSRINNVNDLAIINKLAELPSFIINRSDISGGFLNIYTRFHSSQMDEVSSILSEYTSDTENSRVDWLGPSPGITSLMALINSEYPISLITYQIPFEKEGDIFGELKSESLIAEVKNMNSRNGAFRAVLYSEKPLNENTKGLFPISKDKKIHMVEMENTFYSLVREAANNAHIMRVRFFIKPFGDRLETSVFVPTENVYEYYSILFDIARKHGNKITVKHILPFTQEVWNFV